MSEETKIPHRYNAVVLDTISQVMTDVYVQDQKDTGTVERTKWRDYGVELMFLYQFIKSLNGSVICQIIGREGSGKTVGARTLNPATTMYLNQDKKPLTFTDAEDMYPNDRPQGQSNSLANYKEVMPEINEKKVIEVWTPIRKAIQYAYDNRIEEEKFVVFIVAHVEVYKGANGLEYEKLKTLGHAANKLNVEGGVVWSFYTKVDPTLPRGQRNKLTMHNSGFNTARVPMGKFDEVDEIANDYQLILNKINNKQI